VDLPKVASASSELIPGALALARALQCAGQCPRSCPKTSSRRADSGADLLITNWFQPGSTDVHRRPGTYTGQGVGAARDSAGVHRACGRSPPLLSWLLSGAGEPHEDDWGRISSMPAAGRLHRLELAANPWSTPDGFSWGTGHRGSRAKGAAQNVDGRAREIAGALRAGDHDRCRAVRG
jgi:hypothetical protein